MATVKSDFLNTLHARGFIHQTSDEGGIDALATNGKLVAYVGYDCTGPSLHIGHLLSIMMLHWLQHTDAGKPITLMGGGTTRVGDPSGKDETRILRTVDEIDANKASIQTSFARILTFEHDIESWKKTKLYAAAKMYEEHPPWLGSNTAVLKNFLKCQLPKNSAIMVDNAEWLAPLNYIAFLRDVGRHFSVNRMLTMDSVKLRLERESELSFIEFNYMLLQSYDYVELARRYGCNLQMGGSDQWGNIVNGIDLGRRMGTHQLYALTCPLLTTSSGAKMGKTAQGAVWLNEAQLSAYDYWQYWRNTEDADVGRFLKLFTLLPLPEVARLAALGGAEINEAKKILATEATALIHGRDKAVAAAETARLAFEQGAAAEGLPVITADLSAGVGILKLAVDAGLASSNGEARKAVANGGLSLNGAKVTDPNYTVTVGDLVDGQAKLSMGKKRHVLVKAG
ncbi:MAG: tyrosine--tRNA ligase [Hyphomicrobium aestuarii]|nr:tyrosine--tRNA ligase [Hyphomicrobium aestuarii]